MDARSVEPLVAEGAAAVRVRERHDDDITDVHGADVGAEVLDDAYGLMSHAAAGLVVFHRVVRPEIAAADAGAGDFDQGVGRLYQADVGYVLDTDVADAIH
jgi:hypothetical protein